MTEPLQKRAKRTVESLVAAGFREFNEHGWDGTTVRSISDGAGVSVGTFYRYFDDKAGLLREIAARRYRELMDAVYLDPTHGDEDREKLIALAHGRMVFNCQAVLEYHRKAPGLHTVLTVRRCYDPKLDQLAARVDARLLRQTVEMFTSWGITDSVTEIALAVFNMIESTVVSAVSSPEGLVDEEALISVLARMGVAAIFGGDSS